MGPRVLLSTWLLKDTDSRNMRPLRFVSELQNGPHTSPQSVCVSLQFFPLHSFRTTGMPVLGVWFMIS